MRQDTSLLIKVDIICDVLDWPSIKCKSSHNIQKFMQVKGKKYLRNFKQLFLVFSKRLLVFVVMRFYQYKVPVGSQNCFTSSSFRVNNNIWLYHCLLENNRYIWTVSIVFAWFGISCKLCDDGYLFLWIVFCFLLASSLARKSIWNLIGRGECNIVHMSALILHITNCRK